MRNQVEGSADARAQETGPRTEAMRLRSRASACRAVARGISLRLERERLFAEAAALEAEADRLERGGDPAIPT